MSKKKKSLEAKIVKHTHRKRFQEYVRQKGRDKATIGYVYWNMFLRSGKGNVFELKEELFLGDLGIGKDSLRPARKTLVDDGWLSKAAQKIDPLTGKWGTAAWTVNIEPVACSAGVGAVACLTDDGSADVGSPDDGSVGDTVVLHLLDASNPEASTYPVSPSTKGVTSSDLVSKQESGAFSSLDQKDSNPSKFVTEEKTKATPTPEGEEVDPVFCEVLEEYIGETHAIKELGECFPAFKDGAKPTREEKRLMVEIIVHLNQHQVLAKTLMEYARKHKQNSPGLIPRSVAGLHKAVFEGSSTNGPLAQTKEHDPKVCALCVKELHAKPCDHCHGSTWNKPTIEHGRVYCQECMTLAPYRRHSERTVLTAGSI